MAPVLYSFRRCPYAIRARMTLWYAGIVIEHREVLLSKKPNAMLDASSKGTVPILVLPDSVVLEESRDIMRWALAQHDPQAWWNESQADMINALIDENDDSFKTIIDHYKYSDRFPEQSKEDYRSQGEGFLRKLEQLLVNQKFLLGDRVTMADVALFPFVRQFAMVDNRWWEQAPFAKLRNWLEAFKTSSLFLDAMTKIKPWSEGDPALHVGNDHSN
jgi:glutathione S-transferase